MVIGIQFETIRTYLKSIDLHFFKQKKLFLYLKLISGVGDTPFSFGVDFDRFAAWNDRTPIPYGGDRKQRIGDTIGCFLNLKEKSIGFSLNGKFYGWAWRNIYLKGIDKIYPALTLAAFQRVTVNFGEKPFSFPPQKSFGIIGVQTIFSNITNLKNPCNFPVGIMLPMFWCIQQNNIEHLEMLLLKNLVDVNTKDQNGKTAIQYASELGLEPIVKLLIKYKPNINHVDSVSQTALHKGKKKY